MNLTGVIRKSCPNLDIDSFEYLDEGDFCRAFLVNGKLVFRFAKHEEARRSLQRENCLLPKIARFVSLSIPQPLYHFLDGSPQESFIAYEFLPAEALTRERYLTLDEKTRTRCAAQTAEFLGQFHTVALEMATKCGVQSVDYREKYASLLKVWRSELRSKIAPQDFAFVEKLLENSLAEFGQSSCEPVLLHGDLSPDHVLFDGERVTSIIDFGDLMIGDAAWDFLWIYEDYGADFFARAVENYPTGDKESLIARVKRFSKLEAAAWIVECVEAGDDFSEPLRHLLEFDQDAASF